MRIRRNRTRRGFTLIEMLFTMLVMGIVMSLAAYEFTRVVQEHTLFESHLTAEQQARLGMAKITAAVRLASVDITDNPNPDLPPSPPVVQPEATSTPLIEFTEVSTLGPDMTTGIDGQPNPCYVDVTIQYQTPAPVTTPGQIPLGSVTETSTPVSEPCPTMPPTFVIPNVASFAVTPVNPPGVTQTGFSTSFDVTLEIESQVQSQNPNTPSVDTFTVTSRLTPLIYGVNE
jgi:prepilin-type N-terminal cleavage/methylation domain-containing protein